MTHYPTTTDELLLRSIREDDILAYEELYKRHWQLLYNTAYKRLKNQEQCKDTIQDVFTDLWQRRKQLVIQNAGAYLHTAVRFQIFKLITRGQQVHNFMGLLDVIVLSPDHADNHINEKEIRELVLLWADTLPRKRRKVFLLHYNQSLTTKEIALELKITQKTAQNHLKISLNDLKTHLSKVVPLLLTQALFHLMNR